MAVAKVVISTEELKFEDMDNGAFFKDAEDNLCIKDSNCNAIRLSDGDDVTSDIDDSVDYEVIKGGSTIKIDI